jgi:hypothetical protein
MTSAVWKNNATTYSLRFQSTLKVLVMRVGKQDFSIEVDRT